MVDIIYFKKRGVAMTAKSKVSTSKEKISKVIEQAIKDKHNDVADFTTDLFSSLDFNASGAITKHDLINALKNIGILEDDPRVSDTIQNLSRYYDTQEISLGEFKNITRSNITIIEKALKGHLIIPSFKDFCDEVDKIYDEVKSNKGGGCCGLYPTIKTS